MRPLLPSFLPWVRSLVLLANLLGLALGHVTLSDPFRGLDKLHHINDLLAEHDGEGDCGEDPGDGAVHFIGTCCLHGSS